MAEPADINVDELRRRARRRLVGAVVLALAVAVIVPMLLETEQKPLGEDVSVKIPPIDDGKFVNRLNDHQPKAGADRPPGSDAPKESAGGTPPSPASERTSKYDTRIPDAATGNVAATGVTAAPNAPADEGRTPEAKAPAVPAAAATAPAAESPPASARAVPVDAAKPAAPPPKASAVPAPREGFAVQLAAFADDKGANALAGRLKRAGYAAYTEPLKTSKGTLWRVRVGPYPSHGAAVAARDRLKTEGQSGIVAAIK